MLQHFVSVVLVELGKGLFGSCSVATSEWKDVCWMKFVLMFCFVSFCFDVLVCQAYRWIIDSRDGSSVERLQALVDHDLKLYGVNQIKM
jgi:hypothetical protein